MSVDFLLTKIVMIGFSTRFQKVKHIVMHGGIEQVDAVETAQH